MHVSESVRRPSKEVNISQGFKTVMLTNCYEIMILMQYTHEAAMSLTCHRCVGPSCPSWSCCAVSCPTESGTKMKESPGDGFKMGSSVSGFISKLCLGYPTWLWMTHLTLPHLCKMAGIILPVSLLCLSQRHRLLFGNKSHTYWGVNGPEQRGPCSE